MAITPIQLVAPQSLATTATIYYTSTNIKTRIDKATFTNTDENNAHKVSIYLVPPGGTATASNLLTNQFSIAAGETWNCPDVIGQILIAGGTIQALSDTVNSITFMASGVTISP